MAIDWFLKIYLRELKEYIRNIEPVAAATVAASAAPTAGSAEAAFLDANVNANVKPDSKTQEESKQFLISFIDKLLASKGDSKTLGESVAPLMEFCNTHQKSEMRINKLYLASGLILLGICYRNGLGTGSDLLKAVACFEDAIKYENYMAHEILGDTYFDEENGWVKKDAKKAFEHYKKGAEQHVAGCLVMVGEAHFFGSDGFPMDRKLGSEQINESARLSHVPAKIRAAAYAFRHPERTDLPFAHFNANTGFTFLTTLIEQEPDCLMACDYLHMACGFKKEFELEKKFLELALTRSSSFAKLTKVKKILSQGSTFSEALSLLSDITPSIQVVEALRQEKKSLSEAIEQRVKTLPVFCLEATYQLGLLYEEGRYIEEDLQSAFIYYSLGAARGDLNFRIGQIRCLMLRQANLEPSEPANCQPEDPTQKSIMEITTLQSNGQATEANASLSSRRVSEMKTVEQILIEFYNKFPNSDIRYLIGLGFEYGLWKKRVFLDSMTAQRWYRLAAENGHIPALYKMMTRELTQANKLVAVDLLVVEERLKFLAEHDHSGALCRLGQFALAEAGIELEQPWQAQLKEASQHPADFDTSTVTDQASISVVSTDTASAPSAVAATATQPPAMNGEVKGNREQETVLLNNQKLEANSFAKEREAFGYFERAEQFKSCYEARYYLCWMYFYGIGIGQNIEKSREFFLSFQESSNRGRMEASFFVAKCYEKGIVPKPKCSNMLLLYRQYETFLKQHEAYSKEQSVSIAEFTPNTQKSYESRLAVIREKHFKLDKNFIPLYTKLKSLFNSNGGFGINLQEQTVIMAEYAYEDMDEASEAASATASGSANAIAPATSTRISPISRT